MCPNPSDECWATRPQDTRERTCECTVGPLSVLHTLRVARHPDPTTVTVTRTHEATVEWTADLGLQGWLRATAEVFPPYATERFGESRDEWGDRARPGAGVDPARPGSGGDAASPESDDGPVGAGADGRFRAAPVDATVRPEGGDLAWLSDPYHYWNTPMARLLADENYPDGVVSLTMDLLDGPKAVWTAEATAAVDPAVLPGDREEYARVGLEFTARERFRRPSGDDTDDPLAEPWSVGDPGSTGDPETTGDSASSDDPAVADATRPANDPWESVGEPSPPDTDRLAPAVEATLPIEVREHLLDSDDELAATVDAAAARIAAVWRAFRRREGDPYAIPERAVEAATSPFDP